MVERYVAAYAVAWALTSVLAWLTGRRLVAVGDSSDHPLLTSMVAGALWPIVLLGLVEAAMLSTLGLVRAVRRPSQAMAWEMADVVTLP